MWFLAVALVAAAHLVRDGFPALGSTLLARLAGAGFCIIAGALSGGWLGAAFGLAVGVGFWTDMRGLVAGQIRAAAWNKRRKDINPNTLTVSLGRYKEKGLVRIEGREWFYVPQPGDRLPSEPNEAAGPAPSEEPAASISMSDSPSDAPSVRPVDPGPGGGT